MIDARGLDIRWESRDWALVAQQALSSSPVSAVLLTVEQRAGMPTDVVDGAYYFGAIPLVVAVGEAPLPRVLDGDIVDAIASRTTELQAAIRAVVDSVLPRDEREIALADYCDMLLGLLGGAEVDGEAATELQAKRNFTMRARLAGVKVKADCDACTTMEQLAAFVVDFVEIGGI